jgi:hypothetical protein
MTGTSASKKRFLDYTIKRFWPNLRWDVQERLSSVLIIGSSNLCSALASNMIKFVLECINRFGWANTVRWPFLNHSLSLPQESTSQRYTPALGPLISNRSSRRLSSLMAGLFCCLRPRRTSEQSIECQMQTGVGWFLCESRSSEQFVNCQMQIGLQSICMRVKVPSCVSNW